MQNIKITLIQPFLFWESAAKNLPAFDKRLSQIKSETDLIVLPEMFNTAFTPNAEANAESMDGLSMKWLKAKAKEKECVICTSILINDKEKLYNRLIWMKPNGEFETYDKRHLFTASNEHLLLTSGEKKIIVELNGWKICPLICYDLRFPVWSRNTFSEKNRYEYDCLIFVANWPERRNHSWKSLLVARAIENQAYVVGVNRVGKDGKGIIHSGDSAVVEPKGKAISNLKPNVEGIETVELSYANLEDYRKLFQIGSDWDDFKLLK